MATAGAPKVECGGGRREPPHAGRGRESGDDRVTAQADAGGRSAVIVLIRNQSGVVDNYRVGVNGVPAEWWTAPLRRSTSFRSALPGELRGGGRAPVPPAAQRRGRGPVVADRGGCATRRHSSARRRLGTGDARDHAVSAARERAPPGHRQRSPESRLRDHGAQPRERADRHDRLGGRHRGRVRVRVRLTALPRTSRVDAAGTTFTVRPRKQIWIGRSVDRRFEVVATGRRRATRARRRTRQSSARSRGSRGGSGARPDRRSRRAVLALLLHSEDHERSGSDRGKKADAAPAILEDARPEAVAGASAEKVANAPGGTIVGVVPAVGKKVKKGTVVQITVAQPAVPKLIGKTQRAGTTHCSRRSA